MAEDSECPTCPICQGNVGFPVFLHTWMFPDTCKCRQPPMCLTCVRDMLQLNNRKDPHHTIYASCIICRKELHISQDSLSSGFTSRQIYKKDYDLAKIFDEKFGKITCPRCENWEGSRIDWDNKHLPECPNAINRCSFAWCTYTGKEILEHKKVCQFAPKKCEHCGTLIESTMYNRRLNSAESNMKLHYYKCLPSCVKKLTDAVDDFNEQRNKILRSGRSILELADILFMDEIQRKIIDIPLCLEKLKSIDPTNGVDMANVESVNIAFQRIDMECRYCRTIIDKFREILMNM